MHENIHLHLISPPGLPEKIIERKTLQSKLSENRNKQLILICAAAGYGKTVLLADYIRRFRQSCCWLQGNQILNSASDFFIYLISAIKKVYDKFGSNLLEFIKSSQNNINTKPAIPEDLAKIFLNDLAGTVKDELTIVIDDYHITEALNYKLITGFFDFVFSVMPPNIKFIISTRENPGFKYSRLAAKRNFFKLDTPDFLLSAEETRELSQTCYSLDFGPDEAEKINDLTQGWITALHLMLQSKEKTSVINTKSLPEDIFRYFAEDIYNSLSDIEKEFAIHSSILHYFTPDETNRLLKINQSDEIIEKLLNKNIFIEYHERDTTRFYGYQKLFRSFLQEELFKNHSEESICEKYKDAALIYKSRGDLTHALELLVKANEQNAAIELFNASFESMMGKREFGAVEHCLKLVNEEARNNPPGLAVNSAKYYLELNNAPEAEKYLHRLEFFISKEENSNLRDSFKILEAQYFILINKYDKAIEILNFLLSGEPCTNRKEILFHLAKALFRKGFENYDKVLNICSEILESANHDPGSRLKTDTFALMGNIYFDKGEFLHAIKYYEAALPGRPDESYSIDTLKHIAVLCDIYSSTGNYTKAYDYLIMAENIYQKFPVSSLSRIVLRCRFKFFNNIGNYNGAIRILADQGNDRTVKDNPELLHSNYLMLCELYYLEQNKSLAIEAYNLSRGCAIKENEYIRIINSFFLNYYCSSDIRRPETEKVLIEVLELHLKNNLLRVVPFFEFFLADYYIKTGAFNSAISYLEKSLNAVSAKKHVSFAEQQFLISRHIFDFAVAGNIEKKFVKDLQLNILLKKELPFIDEEFRKKLESDEEKITDIKMKSLGGPEFFLRGEPVADDKWIRKKSKILLAYLMIAPGKIHTKDEIMDKFFDDLPPEKAGVVYHSTIYNLRTALKVYNIKFSTQDKRFDYNPSFILYEDKTLRLNPDFYYISDNIEFEKLCHKFRLPDIAESEKIKYAKDAVELYKGDFLPGYYDSWCEELRVKYENMYLNLCEELTKLFMEEQRYEDTIKYSDKLISKDRLNETAYISSIKAYAALQNINMAKSRFSLMLKAFEDELGEKPSKSALDKIKLILGI